MKKRHQVFCLPSQEAETGGGDEVDSKQEASAYAVPREAGNKYNVDRESMVELN